MLQEPYIHSKIVIQRFADTRGDRLTALFNCSWFDDGAYLVLLARR